MEIKTDIVIVGAGISGLWLTNLLSVHGFNCILLEKSAIGGQQTINSQGMLHSGVKYALQGKITPDTKAIKDAPLLWNLALQNNYDIKLTKECILTDHQYLWSSKQFTARFINFLLSKLLQSLVQKVQRKPFPAPFDHPEFRGSLYKLKETVLAWGPTLTQLFQPIANSCIKIQDIKLELTAQHSDHIKKLLVTTADQQNLTIEAKQYIFTAGEGNGAFLQYFNQAPQMQLRPLHMVAVKSKFLPKLYGHHIRGMQPLPVVSITANVTQQLYTVWICGGEVAEKGVGLTAAQQIQQVRGLLQQIFPWLNFTDPTTEWGSFMVNRAENLCADGKKPTHATWFPINNAMFAWPTKLVLAPMLAAEILNYLQTNIIKVQAAQPDNQTMQALLASKELVAKLPKPAIAEPWWRGL